MTHAMHVLPDDAAGIAAWLARAQPLHRALRPALPEDYEGLMRQMFTEGARMAILHAQSVPAALAVFRVQTTTFHGRRLYLDDLVTDEGARGRGLGAKMLDWCMAQGRAAGCETFALDSGVQRAAAHRFYFRHGLAIASFGFSLPLR